MVKSKRWGYFIVLILFLAVVGIWNLPIPCGGMTQEGYLWDGTCKYGSIKLSSLRNTISNKYLEMKGYTKCSVKEFNIEFTCPPQTTIQFWPKIFNTDFVTITRNPIKTPQTSDELFYEEGFVISRYKLDSKYPNNISVAEYFKKQVDEEKRSIASGNIPSAPGPGTFVSTSSASVVPKWKGAATIKSMGDILVYTAIRNGYVYELRLNSPKAFSNQEYSTILSTFSWGKL